MKLLFFDVETTGVLYYKHSIHQLAGMVVIDGEIKERFDLRIRPHEKSIIEESALKVAGVTQDQVMSYPHRSQQFHVFIEILKKYIDPYNPEDKFFLVGFKNAYFDDEFLRHFFILENDESWGCWFWQNSLDVSVLATHYLMPDRHKMPSFKQKRVALWLGIPVDESRLHDGMYDLELAYAIYLKVKGPNIDDW